MESGLNRRANKRKTAREREPEDTQRLQLALSAGQLGDWSWDVASDRVTLGPRAAECFGLGDSSAITWMDMREVLHPDDRDRRVGSDAAIPEPP